MKDSCSCQPPFTLFPFPTEKKDPYGRQAWANVVSRVDATTGMMWMPNPDDRVCSDHFVQGKPTAANPNPSINLGHRGRSIGMKMLIFRSIRIFYKLTDKFAELNTIIFGI